ncbi:MAG: hypothetical protein Q4F11_08205 [Eubacteriales bacterium]|nr:hypothetical protein [Eubacteriales bacterium]
MKKKIFASVAALAMAAITVFSSAGTVQAEEGNVTDKLPIDMHIEGETGWKVIDEKDAKVINEAFGYNIGENTVLLANSSTQGCIDWEKSSIPCEEVMETQILCPTFSRDENGNLKVKMNEEKNEPEFSYRRSIGWCAYSIYAGDELSFFDKRNIEDYGEESINNNLGITAFKNDYDDIADYELSDVYIIRVNYTTDGKGAYYGDGNTENRAFGYSDFWVLPDGVSTVLNLKDAQDDSDGQTGEAYTVDLSASKEPVSAETFAALLAENATKDVVIKSNNNVTFTFAKGTMQAVEGKESYDFSTTVNSAYTSDMPYYLTQNNFVSQINFNYSGKLPAEASIRFPVGIQYAGKTLYYSLMNADNTFSEVQAVVVDSEGYITVKQNHCSSYVVTTEEPKVQEKSTDTNTANDTNAAKDTETNGATSPKTGDSMPVMSCVLLCVSAIGLITVMKKKKVTM